MQENLSFKEQAWNLGNRTCPLCLVSMKREHATVEHAPPRNFRPRVPFPRPTKVCLTCQTCNSGARGSGLVSRATAYLNHKASLKIGDKVYAVTGKKRRQPNDKVALHIEGKNDPYHYDMYERLFGTADDMEYTPSGFVTDLLGVYLMTAYLLVFGCFSKSAYSYLASPMGDYIRQQIQDFHRVDRKIPIFQTSPSTSGSFIGQNDPRFLTVKMGGICVLLPLVTDLDAFHSRMDTLKATNFQLGGFVPKNVISIPVPFGRSNRVLTVRTSGPTPAGTET